MTEPDRIIVDRYQRRYSNLETQPLTLDAFSDAVASGRMQEMIRICDVLFLRLIPRDMLELLRSNNDQTNQT